MYSYIHGKGGLCVADEVQTGFGRSGSHMWAYETQGSPSLPPSLPPSLYPLPLPQGSSTKELILSLPPFLGVTPDIVTLGKPIANGFPLAAVVTRKEVSSKGKRGGGEKESNAAGILRLH